MLFPLFLASALAARDDKQPDPGPKLSPVPDDPALDRIRERIQRIEEASPLPSVVAVSTPHKLHYCKVCGVQTKTRAFLMLLPKIGNPDPLPLATDAWHCAEHQDLDPSHYMTKPVWREIQARIKAQFGSPAKWERTTVAYLETSDE